jgi:hypothetical protein
MKLMGSIAKIVTIICVEFALMRLNVKHALMGILEIVILHVKISVKKALFKGVINA